MADAVVGRVAIKVWPDTSGFGRRARAEIERQLDDDYEVTIDPRVEGLREELNRRIAEAEADADDIEVDVDLDTDDLRDLHRDLDRLQREIRALDVDAQVRPGSAARMAAEANSAVGRAEAVTQALDVDMDLKSAGLIAGAKSAVEAAEAAAGDIEVDMKVSRRSQAALARALSGQRPGGALPDNAFGPNGGVDGSWALVRTRQEQEYLRVHEQGVHERRRLENKLASQLAQNAQERIGHEGRLSELEHARLELREELLDLDGKEAAANRAELQRMQVLLEGERLAHKDRERKLDIDRAATAEQVRQIELRQQGLRDAWDTERRQFTLREQLAKAEAAAEKMRLHELQQAERERRRVQEQATRAAAAAERARVQAFRAAERERLRIQEQTARAEAALSKAQSSREASRSRRESSRLARQAKAGLRGIGGSLGTSLYRLSGARLARNLVEDVWEPLRNFDIHMPRIMLMSSLLNQLSASVMALGGNILSLGRDMGRIIPGFLAFPGLLASAGVAAVGLYLGLSKIADYAELSMTHFSAIGDVTAFAFWGDDDRIERIDTQLAQFAEALVDGMERVGDAAGSWFDSFTGSIAEHLVPSMSAMFRGVVESYSIFEGATDGIATILRELGLLGAVFAPRATESFTNAINDFAGFLETNAANGNLVEWIETAWDRTKDLGSVVASTYRMFDNLSAIAERAGGASLRTFADGIQGVADALERPGVVRTLENLFRASHDTVEAFNQSISPGLGRFFTMVGDVAEYFGPRVGGTLGGMIGDILGGFDSPQVRRAVRTFADEFSKLRDIIGPILEQSSEVVGILDTLNAAIVPFGTVAAAAVGGLLQVIDDISPALVSAVTDLGWGAADAFSAIFTPLMDGVRELSPFIEGVGRVIGGALSDLSPHVQTALDGLRDFVDNAGRPLVEMLEEIGELLTVVAEKVAPFLKDSLGDVGVAVGDLADQTAYWADELERIVGMDWDKIGEILSSGLGGFLRAGGNPFEGWQESLIGLTEGRAAERFEELTGRAPTQEELRAARESLASQIPSPGTRVLDRWKQLNRVVREITGRGEGAEAGVNGGLGGGGFGSWGDDVSAGEEAKLDILEYDYEAHLTLNTEAWDRAYEQAVAQREEMLGWSSTSIESTLKGLQSALESSAGGMAEYWQLTGADAATAIDTIAGAFGEVETLLADGGYSVEEYGGSWATMYAAMISNADGTAAELEAAMGRFEVAMDDAGLGWEELAEVLASGDLSSTAEAEVMQIAEWYGKLPEQADDYEAFLDRVARLKADHATGIRSEDNQFPELSPDDWEPQLPEVSNEDAVREHMVRSIQRVREGVLEELQRTAVLVKAKQAEVYELLSGEPMPTPKPPQAEGALLERARQRIQDWADNIQETVANSGGGARELADELGHADEMWQVVTERVRPGLPNTGVNDSLGVIRGGFEDTTGAAVDMGVQVAQQAMNMAAAIRAQFAQIMGQAAAVAAQFGAAMSAVASGALSMVPAVVGAASAAAAGVRGAFGGASGWLFGAGVNVMTGLIAGIRSRIGALIATLRGVTALIPANKGPKSVDLALLKPAGQWLMEGLGVGIREGFDKHVVPTLQDVTSEIGGASMQPPSVDLSAVQRDAREGADVSALSGALVGASKHVEVHNHYPAPERSAEAVSRAMQVANLMMD